jgi:hypothetical protein
MDNKGFRLAHPIDVKGLPVGPGDVIGQRIDCDARLLQRDGPRVVAWNSRFAYIRANAPNRDYAAHQIFLNAGLAQLVEQLICNQ